MSTQRLVAFVLLDLSIILALATVLGGLAQRVGQPRVVGEIVAGVLIGPSVLGARWERPWAVLDCGDGPGGAATVTECLFPPAAQDALVVIGQLALALYMFTVGLHVHVGPLREHVRAITAVSVAAVAAPVAVAVAVRPAVGTPRFVSEDAGGLAVLLTVAALLATTALPVLVRILQEKELERTPLGVVGIPSAAVVTVLMFVLAMLADQAARGDGQQASLRVAGTVAYLAVMLLAVRPLLRARLAPRVSLTPDILAWLVVLLLVSSLAANALRLSLIVGGFVAGVVVPDRADLLDALRARLSDVSAFILLPVFLAVSGLQTDFRALEAGSLVGLAVLLAAAVVAKWPATTLAARGVGVPWRQSNLLGVLMNCRGFMVLAVSLVALEAGTVTPQLQAVAVVMALVTTVMTGPLVDRLRR